MKNVRVMLSNRKNIKTSRKFSELLNLSKKLLWIELKVEKSNKFITNISNLSLSKLILIIEKKNE